MKIGELADKTGMAPSAIRYYEQSGLLPKPERGANGYRDYAEAAIERLRRIRMAQSLGFSLDAIRSVFASNEELSKDDLIGKLDGRLKEIEQLVDTLRAQHQHLRNLRATLQATWAEGECLNTSSLENGRIARRGKH
jgi:DNA-binding transcriptional MerR regulator